MRRRTFLWVVASGSSLGGCGAGQTASVDRLVDIEGRRLHVRTWGSGDPCVIIETGIGESVEPWIPVIERIRGTTRVVAYDRAGYGRSDPGPVPRTAARAASDLEALLSRLGVTPPYIFVGHSLGAVNVMVLAAEHPRIVAGLVLLDPPPREFITGERFPGLVKMASQQTAEFRRIAAEAAEQNETAKAAFFKTLASEHESMFADSAAQLLRIQSFGRLPVTVLASEVANPMFGPEAQDFQRFWMESNRQVAAMSSSGKFVTAPKSTHQIHRDAPSLVAAETRALVSAARNASR